MLESDPPDYIRLRVDEDNTLLWNYLIEGPPGTPYEGGWYWGVLKLPENYPFAPPAILMLTPNGRFETNTRLCLSMSDFHPESWQPAWWLSSLMKGLLSFMCDEELTTGAIMPPPSDEERRKLARASLDWTRARAEVQRAFPDIDRIAEAAREQRPLPAIVLPEGAGEPAPPPCESPAAVAPPPADAQVAVEGSCGPPDSPAARPPQEEEEQGAGVSATPPPLLQAAGAALVAGFAAEAPAPTEVPPSDAAEAKDKAREAVVTEAVEATPVDTRPLAVGESVRVRIEGIERMSPDERQYAGREGVLKKSARPGFVLVLLERPGLSGVNVYFREEQLERLHRVAGRASRKAR